MQKQISLLSLILSLVLLSCNSNNETNNIATNATFEQLVKRSKIHFTPPEGFVEIAPIKNDKWNWNKTFQDPNNKFEVRYGIKPLDSSLQLFDEGKLSLHPNSQKRYTEDFKTILFDIALEEDIDYRILTNTILNTQLYADWGATTEFTVDPEFGQDYKYGRILYLHKAFYGDVAIVFLGNDQESMREPTSNIIYDLTFFE